MSDFEKLILGGISILIRSQYMPGKYDSPESKEHSAKLMDDIWTWTSAYAAIAKAEGRPE